MAFDKREPATIIPPGGQSFEANIDYTIDREGRISGIVNPINLVAALGQFLNQRFTLQLKDGTEHRIVILSDPRYSFQSVE